MKWLLWLAMLCVLAPGVAWGQGNPQKITTCGTAAPGPGSGPPYMDASGNLCTSGTPGTTTAPLAAGAAVVPFTATSSDQALTGLTLPGKVCLTNPQQAFGSASLNSGYINVNWAGGNSVSAYTDQIAPGVGEVCWFIPTNTAPHVSVNNGANVVIGVSQ